MRILVAVIWLGMATAGYAQDAVMHVFGAREAQAAQAVGRKLAKEGLNGGQAEAEIWKAAWQAYPTERFFARCFAQEAEQAYNRALGLH